MDRVQHVPTAIILQFVTTFGVWLLAEHLGLSAVLTMVCYAATVARTSPATTPARMRVPTYAVWETVIFALNILAFIFIGLQIRPILATLEPCGARTVLRRLRRRGADRHRRAPRLAHVLQCRHQVARSPHRVSSAAPDAPAHRRQRPGHLVGRHARHRLAGRGAGPPAGVSVSAISSCSPRLRSCSARS